MMSIRTTTLLLPLALLLAGPLACGSESEPAKPLAEKAEKLEIEKPKAAGVMTFTVDAATTALGFSMDAPIEKIHGKIPNTATSGTVFVDLDDLTKSKALIRVSLHDLELFQQLKGDDGKFGEQVKQDAQNEHARAWLEIGPDAPEDMRTKNELVEFSITSVKNPSVKSLSELKGDERKVTFTASGEFLLHQRKAAKEVEIEATFKFSGDKPLSVSIKAVKPLSIGLDEYDVRPRKGFGVLAAKTLSALAPKVAKEAAISVEFTAKVDPSATMPASSGKDAAPAVAADAKAAAGA
jgi:hypothetical protein